MRRRSRHPTAHEVCRGIIGLGEIDFGNGNRSALWWGAAFLEGSLKKFAMLLDHIQLAMPPGEEGAARSFYGSILSMAEDEKPFPLNERGGVWFRLADTIVHLGVEQNFMPQRKAHPAFLVSNLNVLASSLSDAGFPVKWDEALPGRKRFYSEDPFGNRLEFIHDGHGFTQI